MEANSLKRDVEDQLFRWGKWAYINIDRMLGAKPPRFVLDMAIGYELDDRKAKLSRIYPMPEPEAVEFDKVVCKLKHLGDDYLLATVSYYVFHASLSDMDKARRKGKHYHRRLKDESTTFLTGVVYG